MFVLLAVDGYRYGGRDFDRFWQQLVRHAAGEPYAVRRARLALDVDKIALARGGKRPEDVTVVRTGPDAALWVVDWNNYLFLHNPATPTGPGGAWNNAWSRPLMQLFNTGPLRQYEL